MILLTNLSADLQYWQATCPARYQQPLLSIVRDDSHLQTRLHGRGGQLFPTGLLISCYVRNYTYPLLLALL